MTDPKRDNLDGTVVMDDPDADVTRQRPATTPIHPRWYLAGALSFAAALAVGYIIVVEIERRSTPAPDAAMAARPPAPEPREDGSAAPPPPPPPPEAPPPVAPPPPPPPPPAVVPQVCLSERLPTADGDLGFLCSEADAKLAARGVTTTLAATGTPKESRNAWAGLGWYRMAGAQWLRARCCGEAPTLQGPAALASCQLDDALGAIRLAKAADALEAAAKSYFQAVDCIFKTNAAGLVDERRRPTAAERDAFLRFTAKD
ncbi:MAG: hypothetical protein KC731_28090 [Myxococcales bacterium]|nr:hypothetical protein [Myxococcales bacterium]